MVCCASVGYLYFDIAFVSHNDPAHIYEKHSAEEKHGHRQSRIILSARYQCFELCSALTAVIAAAFHSKSKLLRTPE